MIYCISILKIPVIKLYIDIHLESKSYFLNVIHKYLRVMLSRMKLVTHYVFTTGLLTAISSPFLGFYTALTLSFIISWISNTLIDRLGHEVRGGYIRRTRGRTPSSGAFLGVLSLQFPWRFSRATLFWSSWASWPVPPTSCWTSSLRGVFT